MRSEQEMLDLILDTAKADERIRAVIMNGSRANPHAPRDIFQDFDIVYFVTDVAPFRHNLAWIQRFGELMILQLPDEMQDPPSGDDSSFAYLMQFADGNRIDLGIYPLDALAERGSDSLTVLLLDKDGIVGPLDPPSERDYLPLPPTAKAFADCCNEFWWVCPYVAKGLWREEILYARTMLDQVLREQLMKMLAWHIGVQTSFALNPGKYGKNFQRYLEPDLWQTLQQTYAGAGYDATWEALLTMCSLFERIAVPAAGRFGFGYPHDDAKRVRAHLEHVRLLPRDAKEIYP
ncbi:MAG TPA: aminoglycoside 6-adenylyltransferase [Anaerolineae bacterium]|nr:aminoglycoside 6-adenylyltransferase [Anaerolineae bacterium]